MGTSSGQGCGPQAGAAKAPSPYRACARLPSPAEGRGERPPHPANLSASRPLPQRGEAIFLRRGEANKSPPPWQIPSPLVGEGQGGGESRKIRSPWRERVRVSGTGIPACAARTMGRRDVREPRVPFTHAEGLRSGPSGLPESPDRGQRLLRSRPKCQTPAATTRALPPARRTGPDRAVGSWPWA